MRMIDADLYGEQHAAALAYQKAFHARVRSSLPGSGAPRYSSQTPTSDSRHVRTSVGERTPCVTVGGVGNTPLAVSHTSDVRLAVRRVAMVGQQVD